MIEPVKVLVIARQVQERALHSRAIQRIGHLAAALGSVAEARERRGRRTPDVLLFTPETWRDGGQVLLKSLTDGGKAVRVALVADARSLGRAAGHLAEGVQALLPGPLSTAELDATLERLMLGPPAGLDAFDEALVEAPPSLSARSLPPAPPAEELRDHVVSLAEALREGSATIPNISPVALEVQALCSDGQGSMKALVERIEQDPALALRVLKAANGVAYRGMPPVLDLPGAGRRLGSRRLGEVAQLEALRGAFSSGSRGWSKLMGRMWRHTVATAWTARHVVERMGRPNRGEVYTMALFHNLGELLVVDLHRRLDRPIPRGGFADGGLARDMREQHAELGALLLRSWKLPPSLAAIAFAHHDPSRLEPGTPLARHAWLVGGAAQAVVEQGFQYLVKHDERPSLTTAAGALGVPAAWFRDAAAEAVQWWKGNEEDRSEA